MVSTVNHNQIAVLSSQPAEIGRLFLTVEEAAQRLGVTAGWIYERTRRKAFLTVNSENSSDSQRKICGQLWRRLLKGLCNEPGRSYRQA